MEKSSEISDETLQICSVYYSEKSRAVLELNGTMAQRLNPGVPFVWHAMDNSPKKNPVPIDPLFVRMPGDSYEELGPLSVPHTRGSFQHASAVNKFFRAQNARFILVLDYDFFIVRPNWIREVIAHIKKQNLSFFGSVWHPRYYAKYRYFPSVHCMFIDCARLDCLSLDLRPDPQRPLEKKRPSALWRAFSRLPWVVQRLLLAASFQDRKFIGSSRDTGYRVFRTHRLRPDVLHEEIQPVFKPQEHFGRFVSFFYYPNQLVEWFLPDGMRFIPGKRGYFSEKGFCDLGYPDAGGQSKQWEEYLWRGEPFGVHLRGTKAESRKSVSPDAGDESAFLKIFFERFLEQRESARSPRKNIW